MNINDLLQRISDIDLSIGSTLWVNVLHVNNPHSFYVRPNKYKRFLPTLQAPGNSLEVSEINIGNVYIYKSKLLKCKVRGELLSFARNDKGVVCRLHAIDYGCVEDGVLLRRVWTTLCETPVPALALHCRLAACEPHGGGWDNEATHAMKYYIGDERAMMVVKGTEGETLSVELHNSCPDDIATLLALTDYSNMGYSDNTMSRYTSPPVAERCYAERKLNVGQVLRVRLQSGSLLEQFYVTPVDEYQSYLKDRDDYTDQTKYLPETLMCDLKVNTPIGVHYAKNNKFERGLVTFLMPDVNKAKVMLVDWGVVVEESILGMKILPDKFLCTPPRAIPCLKQGEASSATNIPATMVPGSEFMITIEKLAGEDTENNNIVSISTLEK